MKNTKLKFLTAALLVIGFASVTTEAFAGCALSGSAPSITGTYTGKTFTAKTAPTAKACPAEAGKAKIKCEGANQVKAKAFELKELIRQAKLDASNTLGQMKCANKAAAKNYVAPATSSNNNSVNQNNNSNQ